MSDVVQQRPARRPILWPLIFVGAAALGLLGGFMGWENPFHVALRALPSLSSAQEIGETFLGIMAGLGLLVIAGAIVLFPVALVIAVFRLAFGRRRS